MTYQSIVPDMSLIRQRFERIEAEIMLTADLLAKAVQDQRKAHEGMQKHAMGHDVFVPLSGGRQNKAHENLTKPNIEVDKKRTPGQQTG
jgi:hypothetical protein